MVAPRDVAAPEPTAPVPLSDDFGRPDGARLAALIAAGEWLHVRAGTRLFSSGDPPDGMYVIDSGRVRFFDERGADPAPSAEVGAGYSFGEGSLLLGRGRSRAAIVVRDARPLRVRPDRFAALISGAPELTAWLAQTMAARAAYDHAPAARSLANDTTVVVAVGGAGPDTVRLVHDLAAATDVAVRTTGGPFAHSDSAVIAICHSSDPDATRDALRQADRVIVVALADEPVRDVRTLLARPPDVDPLASPPIELVLVHGGSGPWSSRTRPWSAQHPFTRRHHVRRGDRDDLARLARHLTASAVGLVLGGGGARGMAHIGVIKALRELRIPIDTVGGSSIGAIVGGELAMGHDWEEIYDHFRHTWSSRRLRFDITLPTVSVSSGRRVRRILQETFDDLDIEDLRLEYFCTSVNLSRFRLEIHRRGPAATWIRASASAPGLWPPVVDDDGELHIDGGQLNNVPTDVMRRFHDGPIVAVDLCSVPGPMKLSRGADPPVGWRHLFRRRSGERYPSLVDTLNRCALLGSLQHQQTAAEHSDLYLTPDLGSIGFSSFGRMREAVEIGYRVALEALSDDRAGAGAVLRAAAGRR